VYLVIILTSHITLPITSPFFNRDNISICHKKYYQTLIIKLQAQIQHLKICNDE